jgi:SAM-dependent methyltransferase
MFKKAIKYIFNKNDFSSLNYWEKRYNRGGNSGDGSYGRLSQFKADFINDFIEKNKVHSATEIGCGDGHQVSLINYHEYLGLDVSQTIIDACKIKFNEDLTKKFEVYNPYSFIKNDFPKADLSLSLDVIYHIVEFDIYKKYLSGEIEYFGTGNEIIFV